MVTNQKEPKWADLPEQCVMFFRRIEKLQDFSPFFNQMVERPVIVFPASAGDRSSHTGAGVYPDMPGSVKTLLLPWQKMRPPVVLHRAGTRW